MTVVAITGISGCLGRNLLEQLEVDADISRVIGLDVSEPPPVASSKLTFVKRSVTEDFSDLFVEHGVQIGIHLAFALNPVRDREREKAINVRGTENFLAACAASNVETICVASSATVYGALPDNPDILYEGSPVRAQESFPYAADKVRMEELCFEYVKNHPQVALQIVRPCMIVGPNTKNYLTRMLERPVIFCPWGVDPAFQFVHEDDATRAIYRLVKLGKFGVFNLAGDGALTLSQIAQLAERRFVQLPVFVLRFLAWLGWVFGLNRLSEVPPGFIDYCIHPWLIAGLKIKNEAYFLLRFDTASAFLDYLEQRDGVPIPPEEPQDFGALEDSGEELEDLEIPAAFMLSPGGGLPFQADDATPVVGAEMVEESESATATLQESESPSEPGSAESKAEPEPEEPQPESEPEESKAVPDPEEAELEESQAEPQPEEPQPEEPQPEEPQPEEPQPESKANPEPEEPKAELQPEPEPEEPQPESKANPEPEEPEPEGSKEPESEPEPEEPTAEPEPEESRVMPEPEGSLAEPESGSALEEPKPEPEPEESKANAEPLPETAPELDPAAPGSGSEEPGELNTAVSPGDG